MIPQSTIPAESPADRLATKILLQDNTVRRVIDVRPCRPGCERFLYFIETNLATFPRFVIGTCNAAADDVHLLLFTGAEYTAQQRWLAWLARKDVTP